MKMNLVIWDLNASAKTIFWKFGEYEVAAIDCLFTPFT